MERITLSDTEFVSLAELLFQRGVSLGRLASEIKRSGVWGWVFDDLAHFQPVDPETDKAMKRLARQVELDERDRTVGGSEDLDPTSDLLFFFGWPAKDLPDFLGGVGGQPRLHQRPGDAAKRIKTLQKTIGALLYVIEGKSGCKPHPDFKSSGDLVRHIAHDMRGYRGLSERTLESTFSEARALIDKPE